MAIEPVRAFFAARGRAQEIREFAASSATVPLAAAALGVEEARIAKTLSLLTPQGCILIVAAGDHKLDNAKFKARFSCKAKMVPFEACEVETGHAAGGVCPFCNPEGVRVYLDVSLRRFDTVFPACGSASSAIELAPGELFALAHSQDWVDVCKGLS